MNITTRTTIVSNVQLGDNIRVWLLEEEEGFKSTPETWKCWRRNNVFISLNHHSSDVVYVYVNDKTFVKLVMLYTRQVWFIPLADERGVCR